MRRRRMREKCTQITGLRRSELYHKVSRRFCKTAYVERYAGYVKVLKCVGVKYSLSWARFRRSQKFALKMFNNRIRNNT